MNTEPMWHTSTEIRKLLKISGCHLMHMRERGELKFRKIGNTYFYQLPTQPAGMAANVGSENDVPSCSR
jgi:hypothetical protein